MGSFAIFEPSLPHGSLSDDSKEWDNGCHHDLLGGRGGNRHL